MNGINRMVLLTAMAAAVTVAAAVENAPGQVMAQRSAPVASGPIAFSTKREVIGAIRQHKIRKKETLLDIARQYHLGFNEIQDLYPQLDPWLPPEGMLMDIPSRWILPKGVFNGIIVNIAELRLYCFSADQSSVVTFPISIGEEAWPTPEGTFAIKEKKTQPGWAVPPSLRHKYDFQYLPPGPDNPLGAFWMGLENTRYGIHGTDFPWSIGRAVTRGCIRLYPEDIKRLFELVQPGTRVTIIYEPVKIGTLADRVVVEVHRDIYGRVGNLQQYGLFHLRMSKHAWRVDLDKYRRALERQDGMPVDVTRSLATGSMGNKPFKSPVEPSL